MAWIEFEEIPSGLSAVECEVVLCCGCGYTSQVEIMVTMSVQKLISGTIVTEEKAKAAEESPRGHQTCPSSEEVRDVLRP